MIRGTPLQALKKLGEWETLEMVQRYAHLSARPFGALGDIADYTARTDASCNLTAVTATVTRVCGYPTDVAKYTLPVSFAGFSTRLDVGNGRFRRPF